LQGWVKDKTETIELSPENSPFKLAKSMDADVVLLKEKDSDESLTGKVQLFYHRKMRLTVRPEFENVWICKGKDLRLYVKDLKRMCTYKSDLTNDELCTAKKLSEKRISQQEASKIETGYVYNKYENDGSGNELFGKYVAPIKYQLGETMEDFELTKRRVQLAKSGMSQNAITELFESEQQAEFDKQNQRIEQKKQVEETQILETIDAEQQFEINKRKIENLKQINDELKKMEKTYDYAESLAYYLRKEIFNRIPANSDNSIIIIATQKGDLWSFKVQALPNKLDINKIKRIDIVKED